MTDARPLEDEEEWEEEEDDVGGLLFDTPTLEPRAGRDAFAGMCGDEVNGGDG